MEDVALIQHVHRQDPRQVRVHATTDTLHQPQMERDALLLTSARRTMEDADYSPHVRTLVQEQVHVPVRVDILHLPPMAKGALPSTTA